jgi:hypothetical protein
MLLKMTKWEAAATRENDRMWWSLGAKFRVNSSGWASARHLVIIYFWGEVAIPKGGEHLLMNRSRGRSRRRSGNYQTNPNSEKACPYLENFSVTTVNCLLAAGSEPEPSKIRNEAKLILPSRANYSFDMKLSVIVRYT